MRTRERRQHAADAQGSVDLSVRLLAPGLARSAGFGEVVVEPRDAVRESEGGDGLELERLGVAVVAVDRDVAPDRRRVRESHEERHAPAVPVHVAPAGHAHGEPRLLGILPGAIDVDGQPARADLHLAHGLGGIEERAARELARLFLRKLNDGHRRKRGGKGYSEKQRDGTNHLRNL